MAQSPKTSQGGASLSSKVWLPSMKTVQPVWSQPPGPMRCDCQTTHVCHHPHTVTVQWAGSKKWNGKSWVECVDGQHPPLKTLWVYCPGHAGVKGNDWADRLAGKATLTSGLLLRRSEVLRSLRHYLWTQNQGHYTTRLIAWRRDALKEGVLGNFPWKDQRGPGHHQIRWTLELFQRQCWGNFWEMGLSRYGLFWAHRYHPELNWTVETKMLSVKTTVIQAFLLKQTSSQRTSIAI